jgi:putative ABC transport system substrate-binding protein
MIDRRGFARIAFAGLALPLLVSCSDSDKDVPRIGVLAPGELSTEYEKFLRDLGWIEGKNIVLVRRDAHWNFDLDRRLTDFANELVRLKVDLIVTEGTQATLAAKKATITIPIVMTGGDPVATGIVSSLARPGGNITGYSVAFTEIALKKAALLHELLPGMQRVAVTVPPKGYIPIADFLRIETDKAYRSLQVQPTFIEVTPKLQIEDILAEATRAGAQAWQIDGGNPAWDTTAVMQAAIRQRLPTIVGDKDDLDAGALLYFEPDNDDANRRIAAIIDKILRGAKPADIPIEQPTRFKLGINFRTAKALGITVPDSMRYQADEQLVIR